MPENIADDLFFDFVIVHQLAAAIGGTVSQDWDEDGNRMDIVIHVPKQPVSGKMPDGLDFSEHGIGGGIRRYMDGMDAEPVIDARLDKIFLVSGNSVFPFLRQNG